ncbi:Phosphoric monoester hydrolase [Mycena indigotica]|uniref:Putative gamma-glutamylcyclotransferase n=1 Tax=Mycena indigotica TaxID=2126181 RepID=A0A8H6TAL2_9AGAR|nr:Phosphoric monoester hydrolase [Mycena indigotica]KAF7312370.1 Phosphoric monoester hydrolase [Mycena indigotica]
MHAPRPTARASYLLPPASMSSAFFYGTLMHPRILTRVIGSAGAHLRIAPAVLLGYTRHKVRYADYPGIIPNTDDDDETCSVRGTLVTGLTPRDVQFLDTFEGSEYKRQKVAVHVLAAAVALSDYTMPAAAPAPLPARAALPAPGEAETYVYIDRGGLLPDVWDFAEFVAENAWKWYDSHPDEDDGIAEVERRRAAGTTAVI